MIIDILFAAIAGISFMVGYRKGVIKLILTVFSAFIGFLLTVRFTPNMNQLLEDFFDNDSLMMPILSFVLTFIVAMVFIRIAAQIAEAFFKSSSLGEFNQIAGGVLLAILGLVLYSGVIWFLVVADIVETLTVEEQNTIALIEKDFSKETPPEANFLTIQLTDDELLMYDLTVEEYEELKKGAGKTEESKTLPLINIFLFQFEEFMKQTSKMFAELFKDIEVVWKENQPKK